MVYRFLREKVKNLNKTYLALFIFGVLVLLFYGNTLANGFVFDDMGNVVNNEYLRSFTYFPKIITGCITEFVDGGCNTEGDFPYYRPVVSFSYFLGYRISSEPFIFHLMNILYFLMAAALVFWFTKLLVKKYSVAVLAAVFFIAHPINSVPVNWISAVPELTATIFVLLAAIFYILYRQKQSNRYLIAVLLLYFLALLSKETAIVLPVLLLVYDQFFTKHKLRKSLSFHKIRPYALFVVPVVLFFILKFSIMGARLGGQLQYFDEAQAWYIRIVSFGHYIWRVFYPQPLALTPSGIFEAEPSFISMRFLISLGLTFLYLATIVFFMKKKHYIISFSLLWFVVFLAPAIFFLTGERDQLLSNRFVFIPIIGFVIPAGVGTERLFRYSKQVKYGIVAGVCVLGIISWTLVFSNNQMFKDDETMYVTTIEEYPDAHRFRRALGEIYFLKGEVDNAQEEFEYLIQNVPDWADITMAYKGLGDIYIARGDKDKAFANYVQAANTGNAPRDYITHYNIGLLYLEREESLNAFASFCKSVSLFPTQQGQQKFDETLAVIKTEYIEAGILHKSTLQEFELSSVPRIRYFDKRCDEKVCQFAFNYRADIATVLPPFLITAAGSADREIKITNKSYDPNQGIIILETDALYENAKIQFLFPTCERVYDEENL